MIRLARTDFSFNGMPKGLRFTFDPETDHRIVALLRAGLITDITEEEHAPSTTIINIAGIESLGGLGDIGGQGQDQPHESPSGGDEADPSAGQRDVQGHEGTGAKVAKSRKSRADVSTDR